MVKEIKRINISEVSLSLDDYNLSELEDNNEVNCPIPFVLDKNNVLYPLYGNFVNSGETEVIILKSSNISECVKFCSHFINPNDNISKSIAVEKFVNCSKSIEETAKELLPVFKDNPSIKISEKYLHISKLNRRLLKILRDRNFSLKNAYEFTLYKESDSRYLPDLFKKYSPSASQIRIISSLLFEIGNRDNESFKKIIVVIENEIEEKNAAQNVDILIKRLHSLRYPELDKTTKNYDNLLKKMNLPGNVKIIRDKNFESDNLKLNISFKSSSELQTNIDKIAAILQSGYFDELMSLITLD